MNCFCKLVEKEKKKKKKAILFRFCPHCHITFITFSHKLSVISLSIEAETKTLKLSNLIEELL
jgi:hypothetical protein